MEQVAAAGGALHGWREALIALPLTAVLGAMLAFRPVRRGTPSRDPAVIQTQVVLAVIGAAVMLAALSVGLAAGVGIYAVAVLATVFTLAVLWALEPEAKKAFTLKVAASDPAKLRSRIESLLRAKRVRFELRGSGPEEVSYEVLLPQRLRTDRIANEILALEPGGKTAVTWEEKEK